MPVNLLEYFDTEINTACAKIEGLKDREDVRRILETLRMIKDAASSGLEEPSADRNDIVMNGLSEVLKTSQKYMNDLDPAKNPEEKSVAAEFAAMQKPFACYLDNLKKGKSMKEALSDFSWVDGYFGEAKGFEDRADYVPGKYKAGTLKESADAYLNALNGMKQNYYSNLSSLTGYDKAPQETFLSQAYMFRAITKALNPNAETNPFEDAVKGHRFVWQTVNNQRIENLDQNKMVSSYFIDMVLDEQANKVVSTGTFDAMRKAGPQAAETLDTIQKECFKLYFTRSDKVIVNGAETKVRRDLTGATKEQREIFDSASYPLQVLNYAYAQLSEVGGIDDDDSVIKNSFVALRELNNKVLAYVRGEEGAAMPAEQELSAFADILIREFDDVSKDYMFIDHDFDDNIMIFPSLLRDLAKYEPSLAEKSRQFSEKVQKAADRIRDNIILDTVKTKLDSDHSNLEKFDNDFFTLHSFEKNGVGSHDQYICDKFVKMASDPEYNRYMVQKAREAIAAYAVPQKDISSQAGGFPAGPDGQTKYKSGDVCAAAYKVYILGTALEQEHERIAVIKSGERDVQKPKPEIMVLVTKKNVTIRDINNARKLYEDFGKIELNKVLPKIKPADFVRVMNGEAKISDVSGVKFEAENRISRMDSRIIRSLTQKSGNFYAKNSKQYSDIGDALRVLEDKAKIKAQTKEDYLKLFQATSAYMMVRDSKPASRNGQLRFDSAAKLTALIINKVKNDYPQYRGIIDNFININMARSKVFRDEYVSVCRNGIKAILGEGDTAENYDRLSPEKKREVRANCRFVIYSSALDDALGKDKFIRGKAGTPEQLKDMLDKCASPISATDSLCGVFKENPASYIDSLCDPARTAGAISDLKIKQDILTFEPIKLGDL